MSEMTYGGLELLEKKTWEIEKGIIDLQQLIHKIKRRKVRLSNLVKSIANKIVTETDTTKLISKMRQRGIKWLI